jgi:hypothetical protein
MTQAARSAITISVLLLLLVIAALWGWSAATDPLPAKVDTPVCVDRTVAAGDRLFPQDVTVSVYNASAREGLAGRTMQLLTDDGFVAGESGNVSSRDPVATAEIWTLEPQSPAVKLVASHLGRGVEVERRDAPGAGVTVVVGDDFEDLAKGRKSVEVTDDAEICSPPVG